METIFIELISTILQIIVFTSLPFIFFLIRKDKTRSFFHFIGFIKPTGKSTFYVVFAWALILLSGFGMVLFNENIKSFVQTPPSVAGELRLMGFSFTTMLRLFIIAFFKTSLSEEILFRGFIAKHLVIKLGFRSGNLLQAVIFGGFHLLLFLLQIKAPFVIIVFIFSLTTTAGWIIGLIKEKYANGSIIPGWIAHGLGNALSYYIIAFII